jgi:hypothetical protein
MSKLFSLAAIDLKKGRIGKLADKVLDYSFQIKGLGISGEGRNCLWRIRISRGGAFLGLLMGFQLIQFGIGDVQSQFHILLFAGCKSKQQQ